VLRTARLFAAALAVWALAAGAAAQQLPPTRCGAAATCQPSGFQTLYNDAGDSGSFFGMRMRFGNGFEFGLVRPPGWSNPFPGTDPVAAAADLFVRKHPLKAGRKSGHPSDSGENPRTFAPHENPGPPSS
jgi:hypothetical protein